MDQLLLKPGLRELAGSSLLDGKVMDATDDLFGSIELVSVDFDMKEQTTTQLRNNDNTSNLRLPHEVEVVKRPDSLSALLYKNFLSATPLDDGVNPTQIFLLGDVNIISLKLWNCMISSFEIQSHANDVATEKFTLSYTDFERTNSHKKGSNIK